MVVAVPPSVVRVPAAFPLGIQIMPTLVRLVAAFAVFANRLVELRFRLLNMALALRMVVRIRLGTATNIAVPKAVVIAAVTANPLMRSSFK